MTTKNSLIAVAIIGILLLIWGIFFFDFGGSTIQSKSIQETERPAVPAVGEKTPLTEAEQTKIQLRIEALEREILRETNDPDRAIRLRWELETMQEKLR